VVASGQFKVISTSVEGDDLMFCLLETGEVIGEVGLFAGRKRTATVIAMKSSVCIVIDHREFKELLRSPPEVSFELLTVLARRLARVSEFVEDTHFLNLPVRLAKKLLDVAKLRGDAELADVKEPFLIDVKLSQEEWGDLVGTTRESVNKQFRTWVGEGLISLEKGKVVIHQVDELAKLANCVVI